MGGIGNWLPASLDSPNIGFTKEGGLWVKLINKTGAPSKKGTLINSEATTDNAFDIVISTTDEPDIIGIVYDDGVPDGSLCRVVVSGKAQVLLDDGTTATRGYWCRTSLAQDGRADITQAAPGGGTITAINGHFREIGHCLESKASGTDVLAMIIVHFN